MFDKVLHHTGNRPYATADDLLHDLRRVPVTRDDERDDLAGLLVRVGEFTNTPDNQRLADLGKRLAELTQAISGAVRTFARQHRLQQSQTAYGVQPTRASPYAQTSLSATGFDDSPNYIANRVEARGTAEIELQPPTASRSGGASTQTGRSRKLSQQWPPGRSWGAVANVLIGSATEGPCWPNCGDRPCVLPPRVAHVRRPA